MFLIDGRIHHIPAPVIKARDSNGAGDVFHGAYTAALALGQTVVDAARFASATAALKCSNGGGWEALPDRESVNALMKESTW
jgi:sulfofructose kinase